MAWTHSRQKLQLQNRNQNKTKCPGAFVRIWCGYGHSKSSILYRRSTNLEEIYRNKHLPTWTQCIFQIQCHILYIAVAYLGSKGTQYNLHVILCFSSARILIPEKKKRRPCTMWRHSWRKFSGSSERSSLAATCRACLMRINSVLSTMAGRIGMTLGKTGKGLDAWKNVTTQLGHVVQRCDMLVSHVSMRMSASECGLLPTCVWSKWMSGWKRQWHVGYALLWFEIPSVTVLFQNSNVCW